MNLVLLTKKECVSPAILDISEELGIISITTHHNIVRQMRGNHNVEDTEIKDNSCRIR